MTVSKRLITYSLLFSFIGLISCSKNDDIQPNNNAQACFTSVTSASMATPIQFTSDCSKNALSYSWDFGDGGKSTDSNPLYTYPRSGTFTVTLTVTATNTTTHTFKYDVTIASIPSKTHWMDITADEIWEAGFIHYVGGSVNIYDATVTIQPGVTVKFMRDAGLNVGPTVGKSTKATLIANGTQASPIIFTTDSSTPTRGYYSGIAFGPGSSGLSSITYSTIEYGGTSYSTIYNGNIKITNTTVAFENNIIRHTKGSGIYTSDMSLFSKFNNNSFSDYETYALELSSNTVHTIGTGNVLGANPIIIYGYFNLPSATWTKRDFDYLISNLTIAGADNVTNSTLTIAPGVTIKMLDGGRIKVGTINAFIQKGTLIAEGTPTSPITFTSASATPGPLSWRGIEFTQGTTNSSLKYCTIEYGGGFGYNTSDKAMIYIFSVSSITIDNCTLRNAGNCAIYVDKYSTFGSIDNNTISVSNTTDGVNLPPSVVHLLGVNNTITAKREIVIREGGFDLPSATWVKQKYPYYVEGNIGISTLDPQGTWLTLAAGTEFRMCTQNSSFSVGNTSTPAFIGGLIAVGTATDPIKFTSDKSPAAPGDWYCINFGSSSLPGSTLQYAIVEYGGSSLGSICISKTNVPVISNCTISNSKTWGIITSSCTPPLTNNTFSNNTLGNINYNGSF